MQTMKRNTLAVLVLLASLAFAGPKGRPGDDGEGPEGGRRAHMMALLGIVETLGLSEAEALKLGERLKALEVKRRPVRESIRDSMKALRAASGGDAAAMAQVDANVARVLDGRAQMAALDKELFAAAAQGQPPEKRAKLAIFLAHFKRELSMRPARPMRD
jgi:hypothetical protein